MVPDDPCGWFFGICIHAANTESPPCEKLRQQHILKGAWNPGLGTLTGILEGVGIARRAVQREGGLAQGHRVSNRTETPLRLGPCTPLLHVLPLRAASSHGGASLGPKPVYE